MTNVIAQYVTYWANDETKTDYTLTFDIHDTSVCQSWIDVIKRKLSQSDVTPNQENLHYSFPNMDNIEFLHNEILGYIHSARKFVPELQWPSEYKEITQSELNYLHQEFHKAEDKLHLERISPKQLPEITTAFKKINFLIHSIETIVRKETFGDISVNSYKMINFGEWDGRLRNPITDEQRLLFKPTAVTKQKQVRLMLGYATIGKNLQHCAVDDDPQVVRDQMLSPQMDIGGEALLVHNGNFGQHKLLTAEQEFQHHDNKISQFIERHDLGDYVDWKDPKHRYGCPPQLGVVSDEHDNWTLTDYYVIAKSKLLGVELNER